MNKIAERNTVIDHCKCKKLRKHELYRTVLILLIHTTISIIYSPHISGNATQGFLSKIGVWPNMVFNTINTYNYFNYIFTSYIG